MRVARRPGCVGSREFSQLHGSVAGIGAYREAASIGVAPAVSRPASGPVRAAESTGTADPIAVIGLGCRLPGALSVPEYWDNLIQGKNSIVEVPKTRWDWELFWDEVKSGPDKTYAKSGGFYRASSSIRGRSAFPRTLQSRWLSSSRSPWSVGEAPEDAGYERDESLIEPVWASSSVTPWAVRSRTTTS